jgi:hypothetical protein
VEKLLYLGLSFLLVLKFLLVMLRSLAPMILGYHTIFSTPSPLALAKKKNNFYIHFLKWMFSCRKKKIFIKWGTTSHNHGNYTSDCMLDAMKLKAYRSSHPLFAHTPPVYFFPLFFRSSISLRQEEKKVPIYTYTMHGRKNLETEYGNEKK